MPTFKFPYNHVMECIVVSKGTKVFSKADRKIMQLFLNEKVNFSLKL